MKIAPLFQLAAAVLMTLAGTASAQTLTPAVPVTGDESVDIQGTEVWGGTTSGSYTLNDGVTFGQFNNSQFVASTIPGSTVEVDQDGAAYGNQSADSFSDVGFSDNNLNGALIFGDATGGGGQLFLNIAGLTPGNTYVIQAFADMTHTGNPNGNGTTSGTEIVTPGQGFFSGLDGTKSVTLPWGQTPDPSNPGQYLNSGAYSITDTFVANSAGTAFLLFSNASGTPYELLDAAQIRDITNAGILLTIGSTTAPATQVVNDLPASGAGYIGEVVANLTGTSTLDAHINSTETWGGFIGGPNPNQNNLNFVMSGSGALTMTGNNTYTGSTIVSGSGKLVLAGSNVYAGPTTISGGGTLDLQGTLAHSPSLVFSGNAGTFNYDVGNGAGAGAANSLSLTNVSISSGDATIQNTIGGGTSSKIILPAFAGTSSSDGGIITGAARNAGATLNFVEPDGTPGLNNIITFTSDQGSNHVGQSFLGSNVYFNGSNFAYYDVNGYVRGVDYSGLSDSGGPDQGNPDGNDLAFNVGSGSTGGAPTVDSLGGVLGTGGYAEVLGDDSGEGNIQLAGLLLTSGATVEQGTGTQITVQGILKSGGDTGSISGGEIRAAGESAGPGQATMVIRTDLASDTLNINSNIVNPADSSQGIVVKSGAGTLVLNGTNTYTGGTIVNAGKLAVNGSVLGNVSVGAGAALGGHGVIAGTISGSGSVNPGNSPGILTAGATDPTGGLTYNFEFTQAGVATWSNPADSGNDVLRLTTASPFTAALSAANVVNLYFANTATVYFGGFYIDHGNVATLDAALGSATFQYYLADPAGAYTYNGVNYDLITDVTQLNVQMFGDFPSGPVGGVTEEFIVGDVVVAPEPSTYATLLMGLGALVFLGYRRKANRA